MRQRNFRALLGCAALLCAPVPTFAQDADRPVTSSSAVLVRDSFPIGSAEGALCQVQSELRDPAFSGMFDRAWTIICRDAAEPVGRVYALRGDGAPARVAARPNAPACTEARGAPEGGMIADCTTASTPLPLVRRFDRAGSTSYIAEGFAAYDDALRIALASIMRGSTQPGTIRVATTSQTDAAALARIQVANLPPDRALAEGYRQNNSGDYSSAAVYFEALERRDDAGEAGMDPTEFTLNRALQLSNLGDMAEAERLFIQVEETPATDIVQMRLRRNFRAIHAINGGDLDGAILFLDRAFPAPPPVETGQDGSISIGPAVANGINSGSSARIISQLDYDTHLTPPERAAILDAQALALRGTVHRLKGEYGLAADELTGALTQVAAVRGGRVTTIIRLRAQTMGEIALTQEAQGQNGSAESLLRAAIYLLETEYPETMALAAARAKLGAFLVRQGRSDDAVAIYRVVVAGLTAQRRQLTGVYNQIGPYFSLLAERQATHPEAAAEFFAASQLLVRPGVADTQAVLARELSGGSGEASGLFRQATTLARDLERSHIELARLNALPDDESVLVARTEAQTRIDNLATQQTATLARLSEFPQYRAVAQEGLTLADLQGALSAGESYARLTVVGNAVYGMAITPDSAQLWKADIDRIGLDNAVDELRSAISSYEGGQHITYPFDAQAANRLYVALFGPAAGSIAATRHLIFEPDGAMLRLPPNLLVTDAESAAAWNARAQAPGGDPFDMRGVNWLGRTTRISTAVSPLAFRNTRTAPASRATHAYLGMGNNAPVSNVTQVARVRGADPAAAQGCAWSLDEWNKPIAATELLAARSLMGGGASDVVTGAAFTDRQVRERGDLASYRILHFATHGLVTPPNPGCPTRPALLTSFDTADSDGLLSFDEIFDLRIDADLVILSACDTAGQASIAATRAAGVTTGGGSALDGLVRAFIGAGGRSVLASHWPAPDDFDATQRLITGLFAADAGASVADALGRAQDLLMADAATSHPYYWAGFAIIGDGARPVRTGADVAAANAAMREAL